ncbi:MAG TPA: helix-turn-helix transcriptional regulator [Actinophytocola sp.]|jgi:DNA-binding PadR family transcriptional regulator|uniref:PadR family transcriptional regulator n=1 Tax=Actinophytocola sp. TaxID=1872138 RepID=UPI002F93F2FA
MFVVLLALTESDRHGYALIEHAGRLSAGSIRLGEATLYRTLQRMRIDGLIEEIDAAPVDPKPDGRAGRRRYYRITAAGRTAVRDEAQRLAGLLSSETAQALLRSERKACG